MGRGYINVRATGGAVKPLPWRGQRGLGCRSKPLLKDKKGLGLLVTLQGGTLHKRRGSWKAKRAELERGLMEDGRVKPCINKKRRSSLFTERTSLLVRISLILIQVIPVPRILRLSPRGV
jgi:hypothetical protein